MASLSFSSSTMWYCAGDTWDTKSGSSNAYICGTSRRFKVIMAINISVGTNEKVTAIKVNLGIVGGSSASDSSSLKIYGSLYSSLSGVKGSDNYTITPSGALGSGYYSTTKGAIDASGKMCPITISNLNITSSGTYYIRIAASDDDTSSTVCQYYNYSAGNVYASYGSCAAEAVGGYVRVWTGSSYVKATPYIYSGGTWVKAKPYTYSSGWQLNI